MSIFRAGRVRCHRVGVPAIGWVMPGGVGALVLALLLGCSDQMPKIDAKLDEATQKLLAPRKTPQQYMILAVSSEDADVRRDAVARISASRQYTEDWAIKGFVAIACLENDPQTRCVAIRALARTGDPRAAETLLKILNYRDYPLHEVRPPDDLCRWDAAVGLADLLLGGHVPEEYQAAAWKTLRDRLHLDSDRHVRIAAARGLASDASDETVRALIDGLRDEDYAVVHQCEDSLVRLTGLTHNADPEAWQAWYEGHQGELFAHAGEIPESRRPPYRNGFEKAVHDTRELLRWLWPGAKEE